MTDQMEWRYLLYGRVKHRLSRLGAVGELSGVAECGVEGEWYGTGAQQESEHLEHLPRCARCLRALGHAPTGGRG